MKCIMNTAAAASLGCTVTLAVLHRFFPSPALLALAITAGTVCYHLIMRLIVGWIFDRTMKNRADYHRRWYQVPAREQHLYEKLHIKGWKANVPTYEPSYFDPKLHSWDEIAQAMCQAELVHETIILLSFLPLAAVPMFGAFWVFLGTSVAAAAVDLLFVILQRYNRARVVKLLRCRAK